MFNFFSILKSIGETMAKKLLSHQQILDEYESTHKASSSKQFQTVVISGATKKPLFSMRDMMDDDRFMNKAVTVYKDYKPSSIQSKLGHWITYYKIKGLDEQRVIELRSMIRLGIDLEKSTPNPTMTLTEARTRLFEAYEKEKRKDMKLMLLFYATNAPLRLIVLNNTVIVRNTVLYKRLKNTDLQNMNFINLENSLFSINEDKTFAREFKIENKQFLEALDKYVGLSNWTHFIQSSESTSKRTLSSAVGTRPIQTLRHLYISDLVQRGVNKKVFQEETIKLGHSMETALREYATHNMSGFLSN
jgi:hypothetical protein